MKISNSFTLFLLFFLISTSSFGQLYYSLVDDFNRPDSSLLGASSSGHSVWMENEAVGHDDQLQISGNKLYVIGSGDSGSEPTSASIDFSNETGSSVPGSQDLGWAVHFDLNRLPTGWGAGDHGLGWVLGASEADFSSPTVDGYAVLWTGTGSELVLVKFQDGLTGTDPGTPVISTGLSYNDISSEGINVRVEVTPGGYWTMYWEDTISLPDPLDIDAHSMTSAAAHTDFFSGGGLVFTGPVWAHSTDTDQSSSGSFDNFFTGRFIPDLSFSQSALDNSSVLSGTSLGVSYTLRNSGGMMSDTITVKYHLSSDSIYDGGDSMIGSAMVASLNPSDSVIRDESLVIPAGTSAGTWYLVIRADSENQEEESDEGNNQLALEISVNIYGRDLSWEDVSMNDTLSGSSVGLSFSLTNYGSSRAGAHYINYYLSEDPDFPSGGSKIKSGFVDSLSAASSAVISESLYFSDCLSGGYYYVRVLIDAETNVSEVYENNNVFVDSFYVQPGLGDLYLSSLSLDRTTVGPGDSIRVTSRVENGSNAAVDSSTIAYYFSDDPQLDMGDLLIGTERKGMIYECSYSTSSSYYVIPGLTAFGEYYFIARADEGNEVPEADEGNNVSSRILYISDDPDLIIDTLAMGSSTVQIGKSVMAQVRVNNISSTGPVGSSSVSFYVSADSILDGSDLLLSSELFVPDIDTSSSSVLLGQTVWITACADTGSNYIIALADGTGLVNEVNESNNTSYYPLNLTKGLPNLQNGYVSGITSSAASFTSSVTCDGGVEVFERGVCWGTSPNPTISGSKAISGSGTGLFTANITGLHPGTTYYARGYARNSKGTIYTGTEDFQTNNITVTNIGSSTAQVNWGHLGISATNYSVQYNEKYSVEYLYSNVTTSSTEIAILPATTYVVRLRYFSGGTWSQYLEPVEFKTATGQQVMATDIEITNRKPNSVDANWKGNGAGLYKIVYNVIGSSQLKTVTAAGSPATLTVLPGTSYTVKMSSQVNGQWTTYTSPVEFATPDGVQVVAGNVSVDSVTANTARVSWEGSGAENYKVVYSEELTGHTLVVVSTASPVIIPVVPGTGYSVKVSTLIDGQWTPYTVAVAFATPAGAQVIASNVNVTGITASSASVSWDGSGADNYKIVYNITGSSTNKVVTASLSPVTIPLLPDTSYTLKMSSQVNGVWSTYTPAVQFTTPAGAQVLASNVSVDDISNSSARISWDGSGADKYKIVYNIAGSQHFLAVAAYASPVYIPVLPNTNYFVKMASFINGKWSNYTTPVEFLTPAGAQLLASNILVNSITSNSADVSWDGSGADLYRIVYHETGTQNYQAVTTLAGPVTITVAPGTSYNLRMRTLIDGQWSSFTAPVQFTSEGALKSGVLEEALTAGEDVTDKPAAFSVVNMYPNPASDYINLSLNIDEPAEITISLYDTRGALVRMVELYGNTGMIEQSIDLGGLNTGIYIMNIRSSEYVDSRRVIIQ